MELHCSKREGEGRFQAEKTVYEKCTGREGWSTDVEGGCWLPKGQALTLPSAFSLPFKEYLARDNRIRPLSIREIMFTSRRFTEKIED